MCNLEQVCNDLIPESLYRNICLYAQMLYPKEDSGTTCKSVTVVVKQLLRFFGDLEYRIVLEHPNVNREELNIYISHRLGEYLTSLGGWKIVSSLLLEGQKDDFTVEIHSQFRKGSIAGYILHSALHNRTSLSKAAEQYLEDCSSDFDGRLRNSSKCHIFDIEPGSFLKNEWQEIKPAVHYWAALNIATGFYNDPDLVPIINFDKYSTPNKDFYFIPTGFEGFCQVAASYLQLGRSFTPPRSSSPLINF